MFLFFLIFLSSACTTNKPRGKRKKIKAKENNKDAIILSAEEQRYFDFCLDYKFPKGDLKEKDSLEYLKLEKGCYEYNIPHCCKKSFVNRYLNEDAISKINEKACKKFGVYIYNEYSKYCSNKQKKVKYLKMIEDKIRGNFLIYDYYYSIKFKLYNFINSEKNLFWLNVVKPNLFYLYTRCSKGNYYYCERFDYFVSKYRSDYFRKNFKIKDKFNEETSEMIREIYLEKQLKVAFELCTAGNEYSGIYCDGIDGFKDLFLSLREPCRMDLIKIFVKKVLHVFDFLRKEGWDSYRYELGMYSEWGSKENNLLIKKASEDKYKPENRGEINSLNKILKKESYPKKTCRYNVKYYDSSLVCDIQKSILNKIIRKEELPRRILTADLKLEYKSRKSQIKAKIEKQKIEKLKNRLQEKIKKNEVEKQDCSKIIKYELYSKGDFKNKSLLICVQEILEKQQQIMFLNFKKIKEIKEELPLEKLKYLRSINLSKTKFPIKMLEKLRHLKYLEKIDVSGNKLLDGNWLRYISNHKNITRLNLQGTKVEDEDLKHLENLKYLERLNLKNTKITDAGLKSLKNTYRLRRLNLSNTAIKGPGLKYLKKNTRLKRLLLNNTRVGDSGLEVVANFEKLEYLKLNNTNLNDEGVKKISKNKNISTVMAKGTKITNESIKYFAKIDKLEGLYLEDVKIKSKYIFPLTRLESKEIYEKYPCLWRHKGVDVRFGIKKENKEDPYHQFFCRRYGCITRVEEGKQWYIIVIEKDKVTKKPI